MSSNKSVPATPLKSNLSNPQSPLRLTPKTPVDRGRRPPRLVLPNPSNNPNPNLLTQTSKTSSNNNPYVYPTNGYEFVNQFRDFAKSGMSIGEKITIWLYSKISTWSKKWFTHCFLTIVLILYTCCGALLFIAVEGRSEDAAIDDVFDARYELITEIRNLSIHLPRSTTNDEWEAQAARRILDYENFLIDYYRKKLFIITNRGPRIWTFFNAVIYCATIYTTIGYGHIYPTTVTGQALTIAYAIIGIPLFLIVLTDFGKLFTRCIKFFWSYVRRVYYTGSCKRVRNSSQVGEFLHGAQVVYEIATLRRPSMFTGENLDGTERRPSFFGTAPQTTTDAENPKPPVEASLIGSDDPTTPALSQFEIDDEFNLPISLAIFILVVYLLLGGLMYCLFENTWNFFASFYFVFISMSTIGFGDLVPTNPICLLASIFYLVFGLALMSMCINVVQVKLSDTFKDASAKLGATIGLEVNEDGSATDMVPVQIEVTDENDTKTLEPDKKSSLKVPQRDEGGEKPDEAKPVKEVKF